MKFQKESKDKSKNKRRTTDVEVRSPTMSEIVPSPPTNMHTVGKKNKIIVIQKQKRPKYSIDEERKDSEV